MSKKTYAVQGLAIFLILTASSEAQEQQYPLPDVIKFVEQEQHKLDSATVEGVETVMRSTDFGRIYGTPVDADPTPKAQGFEWAFKANKRFRRYSEEGQKKGPNEKYELESTTHTEIYDGKKEFSLLSSKYKEAKKELLQGTLQSKPISKPSPLSFGYQLEDQWVSDILNDGDFEPSGVVSDPIWGKLHGYSQQKQGDYGKEVTKLWFAPKSRWLVVRSELEWDSVSEGKKSHSIVTLDLERVEERDSILFPVQGTMQAYEIENGQKTPLVKQTTLVNKFALNSAPDELFEIKFQPGTGFTDSDTKEYFRIGPNGEKILVDLNGQQQNDKKPMGWLFMVSLTTLLVLTTGALWKKQRRNAAS